MAKPVNRCVEWNRASLPRARSRLGATAALTAARVSWALCQRMSDTILSSGRSSTLQSSRGLARIERRSPNDRPSRQFSSSSKSWDALCAEASAFATEVGRERLINISVAASGGTDVFGLGGTGVIVVWFGNEDRAVVASCAARTPHWRSLTWRQTRQRPTSRKPSNRSIVRLAAPQRQLISLASA